MANFVKHILCESCGGSSNALYDDGSTYCFKLGCGKVTTSEQEVKPNKRGKRMSDNKGLFYEGDFEPLTKRGIDQASAKFYGVRVTDKGSYVYPMYNKSGEIVSSKIRVGGEKDFRITGDFQNALLFGQQLFGTGGKILTITEGQDDAIAAYKMGGGFPAVSVHSASTAVKDIKNNLDFVESYEKVKIAFDNDEPGRKAAKEVAELLSPGKAEIVTFTKYKDANDYLLNKDIKGYTTDFWNSKTFSNIGVVKLSEGWEQFKTRLNTKVIEIPDYWGEAKRMLRGGFACGEITTITADTSVGKTTQLVNLFKGILELDPTRNITALMLETTVGELVSFTLMMELGIDLDIGVDTTEQEIEEAFKLFSSIEWTRRLHIIDHIGTFTSTDAIIQKLRNTVMSTSSDLVLIDPLQQAIPDSEHQTVRSFLDSLLKVAQQLNIAVVQTSHIKNRARKSAYDIIEDDAFGSSAIKQVTWTHILLARDKMAAGDLKNMTKVMIPKCRRTGQTGDAGWMKFVPELRGFVQSEDPNIEFGDEEFG